MKLYLSPCSDRLENTRCDQVPMYFVEVVSNSVCNGFWTVRPKAGWFAAVDKAMRELSLFDDNVIRSVTKGQ